MPRGVYPRTPEHNARSSASHKGKKYKPMSEQGKANIRSGMKKYYENPENRKKISTSMKKYYEEHPDAAKERNNRPEVRKKNSASHEGKSLEEKGHKPDCSCSFCGARRGELKGDKNPSKRPEVMAKIALSVTESWKKPERVAKQIQANCIRPNKAEKFLDELFQQFFPNQIKYIGDGKDKDSIIGGKCPDFIFTDGQKKIIELFGDYWHGEERTGVPNDQHERERIDLFAKCGYQTLVIWEHELKDVGKLRKKTMKFNGAKEEK